MTSKIQAHEAVVDARGGGMKKCIGMPRKGLSSFIRGMERVQNWVGTVLFLVFLAGLIPLMDLPSVAFAEDTASMPGVAPEYAEPQRGLTFPFDHGMHPRFETEWWYLTGHLVPEGTPLFGSPTHYGVQLTFFRRRKAEGIWGQVYAAHGALGDALSSTFSHDIRYGRSGMGGVEAASGRLGIHLLDWGFESVADQWILRWNLPGDREVRLITEPVSPSMVVRQGLGGFSKKAACERCASMYYSVPQLRARGEVRSPSKVEAVSGILWMDHEFMTNALQPDQVGWDWFSIMTERGHSIMLFRVRGREPSVDFFSGTLSHGGITTPLSGGDFSIESLGSWTSGASGTTYPQRWLIRVPQIGFQEELAPILADQEIRGGGHNANANDPLTYWEGAVANKSNTVKGYAELTGYGKPITPGL